MKVEEKEIKLFLLADGIMSVKNPPKTTKKTFSNLQFQQFQDVI